MSIENCLLNRNKTLVRVLMIGDTCNIYELNTHLQCRKTTKKKQHQKEHV